MLRLNPPWARGHSKPSVEKYFVFVLVLNAAAEPSLGSRVFEANFFSCVVLCYSLGTNVFKKQGGMLAFFLLVCSPISRSGVWFLMLRLNPPWARGHSKPSVDKYFVFVLVSNAAAETSLGSRAFETN